MVASKKPTRRFDTHKDAESAYTERDNENHAYHRLLKAALSRAEMPWDAVLRSGHYTMLITDLHRGPTGGVGVLVDHSDPTNDDLAIVQDLSKWARLTQDHLTRVGLHGLESLSLAKLCGMVLREIYSMRQTALDPLPKIVGPKLSTRGRLRGKKNKRG